MFSKKQDERMTHRLRLFEGDGRPKPEPLLLSDNERLDRIAWAIGAIYEKFFAIGHGDYEELGKVALDLSRDAAARDLKRKQEKE